VIARLLFTISATSATSDQTNGRFTGLIFPASYTPGTAVNLEWALPPVYVDLEEATTYYLTAFANFSVSTLKAYGKIFAVPVWG